MKVASRAGAEDQNSYILTQYRIYGFWQEIITLTCPIRRGVWNLPHKFHLYLIELTPQ